ncbi:hypothetical protein N311_02042, partial [Apaloderma vittatum]
RHTIASPSHIATSQWQCGKHLLSTVFLLVSTLCFIRDVKETVATLPSLPEKHSCVHSLQKPWSAQKIFVRPLTRTQE